ncbi:MFS transporter [uncultured Amnibacterium sp.]|uniref:MFS transporter n=1 Tax=uncultured Amnibacterium sp. TaxID=1631851 RepID=UPI0035CAEA37
MTAEQPTATDQPAVVPPGAARTALVLGSLGFFLITLDILIVNVALTRIGRALGGGTAGQQWVIDGYTLAFAALLLLAGNLTDRLGAKRAVGAGIVLFLLASIGCALAPTLGVLIAARVVQGAGAALMLPATMALIREAFPDPRERTHALGIWAVGGAVAGAAGPLIGGLLTTIDWRLVFGINIPVCALMLVLLVRVLRSSVRPRAFDWAGQAASLIGLTALMYGLITGGHDGFGRADVIGALVIAVAALTVFVLLQQQVSSPMLPLQLLRPIGVRIALVVGFAFMIGNFGTVFVNSLYLQQHLGLTPLLAGLVFLPSAAFSIVGNIVSGTLANRFGARVPMVGGLLAMVVGLIGMIVAAPLGLPVLIGACMVLTGAGGSVAMPPTTSLVLASVLPAQAGTASAVFNTFRQIGGAVAIAVFGALIADPAHFVPGMQVSFCIAGAALLVAAVVSLRASR